jgi:predicted transcriptional regulator of viral defense system
MCYIYFMNIVKNKKNQSFIQPNQQTGRETLARYSKAGKLERIERGIYRLPNAQISENESLIVASLIIPKGVICLLSALRFHDLTTQNPFEVWMAIEPNSHRPKADSISLRLLHFSGESLTEGIETHRIGSEKIKVYCTAKTIADCFKFRNKIGLDVALEALREAKEKSLFTSDELWHYAKICRVANVMRPYLEALS